MEASSKWKELLRGKLVGNLKKRVVKLLIRRVVLSDHKKIRFIKTRGHLSVDMEKNGENQLH